MNELDLLVAVKPLAAAIILAGAAIGSGIGIGNVGSKLVEASARQPLEGPRLQSRAFLMSAMLDAVPMIAVAMAMYLLFV